MQRLYACLIYLYPPAFRRAHGREMRQHVHALARAERPGRVARELLLDLVQSLWREWRLALRKPVERREPIGPPPRQVGETMKHLAGDLRFAVRLLGRNPGFTAAAVATLALGIGANTAILSLADATLLRPLKVADPGQLRAWSWTSSYPDFREYERRTDLLAGVAAVSGTRVNLTIDGATDLTRAALVSGRTFSVLGVPAAIGRPLLPSDDRGAGTAVVGVFSHDYWRSHLGSDRGVVGKVIRANGTPVTIVGVAAEGFRGTSLFSNPSLYLPLTAVTQVSTGFFARPAVLEHAGLVWLNVIGRLRPDVSEAQAASAIDALYRRLHPPPPGERDLESFRLIPLTTRAMGGDNAVQVRRFVLLLLGVVGLTLLIGCANLANLLLARAASRRRELALRLALGASGRRIVSQLVVENLLLAALGGAAGLVVAYVTFDVLAAYQLPGGIAIANLNLTIDRVALGAAATLSIATGLLVGAAPAWRASRADVLPALQNGARATKAATRLRNSLVAAQVALSLVLLAGTGLFLRSLVHALAVPLGFEAEGVGTASVNLGLARYDEARARAFYGHVLERVAAIPGVAAASWTTVIPTSGDMTGAAEIDGYEKRPHEAIQLHVSQVGPDFFRATGIRLVKGRPLAGSDDVRGPGVVVVNQAAADRYWAGRDPIGGRLRFSEKGGWLTVVGIAGNTTVEQLGEEAAPIAYCQFGRDMGGLATMLDPNHLMVRTTGDVTALLSMIRDEVRAIDPAVPVYDLRSFAARIQDLVMPQRMGLTLLGFFSLLAVSLAAVGIYGVASYVTTLRRREIGIRIALGASSRAIRGLVLREGAMPVVAGIAVGVVIALWAGRLVAAFMYETRTGDPATLAAVALVLASVALVATWVPARRAAHVDPVDALRSE